MRYRKLAAAAAVAGLGVVIAAVPSQAALTTFCDGTASDVTVPGDLVVAGGDSCELTNVTVEGDITVRRDANLLLTDATVTGDVRVLRNGFADVIGSEVAGRTLLNTAFGMQSENTEHTGVVNARNHEFFYSIESVHGHHVRSTNGETYLESARLARSLITKGDVFTDVRDTVIERKVSVSDTAEGSLVCASEIDHTAEFTGNGGTIQLGNASDPDCAFAVFGDDVTVTDNAADVQVSGNAIRGDLMCNGNDGAVSVQDNRLRGADLCEIVQPRAITPERFGAETGKGKADSFTEAKPEHRKDDTLVKIDKRVGAAETDAENAGHAFD